MNKIFSVKIYKQGLKQLTTIAINAFAMLLVICILGFTLNGDLDGILSSITLFSRTASITFTPIMTFYLLHFFHRRNSSDFFFSIPYSRACISFSYIVSVITYALVMSALILPALSNDYNILERFTYFIGVFSSYLFIIAVIYLAWSLTNTIFLHLVVYGLILFIPSIIVSLIGDGVYDICSFLDYDHKVLFLNERLNLSTNGFIIFNSSCNYDYVPGIIYTLIIAIFYIALAILLSKKKKSENAGSEMNNKFVRIMTGCAISTFICLLPIEELAKYFYYQHDEEFNFLGFVLIYIIAIAAYFIYQFLATRTFKTIKSSLIGIPILVVINILFTSAILIICNILTNYSPDSNDIDYISFTSNTYMYDYDDSYYSTLIRDLKIEDEKFKEEISEALKESIKMSKEEDSYYYYYDKGYKRVKVLICSEGTKHYRIVNIKEYAYYNLIKHIISAENEEFIKLTSKLPESEYIYDFRIYTDSKYSEKDIIEIYNTYCEELATLSLDELANIVNMSYQIAKEDSDISTDEFNDKYWDTGLILIKYNIDDNTKTLFLNITEKTPKAYALYQKMLGKE